jgi:SAM-dependent methyltransferase
LIAPSEREACPVRDIRASPRFSIAAAALGAILCAPSNAQSPDTHRHRFHDADKWSTVFDDPKRDAWQKPHEVIEALGLAPDAVVADIGSGTGYFAVRLAHRAPRGRVFGVDTEPGMVRHLAERAKREGLANLVSVAGAPEDPKLPEKVDLVLLVNVYHHIAAREDYFRRLQASLKPAGRLAVIDFREDAPRGPPRRERISAERVRAELGRAGYTLAGEHGFLPSQYFLVFRPGKP